MVDRGRGAILLIETYLEGGGVEKHIQWLAKGLVRTGHRVEVLTFRGPQDAKQALGSQGVAVHRAAFHSPLAWLRWVRRLRRGGYRLVHGHLFKGTLFAYVTGRLAGLPVVVSKHNTREFHYTRLVDFVGRWLLYPRVEGIIAISRAVRDYLATQSRVQPERIDVVYYGIERERNRADHDIRQQLQLADGTMLSAIIGRLTRQKGHQYLFDALKMVRNRGIDPGHLLVVGTGELEPQLRRQVTELGLADRVTFLGYRPDLAGIYDSIDVLFMPSLWEGFGLVLLEAMTYGRPVIGSRIHSIPEVVGDAGLLVEPGHVRALADAIQQFVTDRELRKDLAERASRRAEHFSLDTMCRQTLEVYDQATSATEPCCRRSRTDFESSSP